MPNPANTSLTESVVPHTGANGSAALQGGSPLVEESKVGVQLEKLRELDPPPPKVVWVDGRLVSVEQATVSVFDHGLLYGDGVFEGIRIYKGRIFKCKAHVDRLFKSARAIDLDIGVSPAEITRIMEVCIRENGIVDGYIRLIVTRGVGKLGLDPTHCVANVICIANAIRIYPSEVYTHGMEIVVADRPRVPVECLDPRIKSLNYLNNILAKMEAIRVGRPEALMLNTDGFVAECTGDNIFVVKDRRVFTPPASAGALEGITRNVVLRELCPALQVQAVEKMMRLSEVYEADEVFLTGTAAEIVPVRKVGAVQIGEGEPGPITKKLMEKFHTIISGRDVPVD